MQHLDLALAELDINN